ncbi:hypothetical protein [Tunicatimonas pelagia]|uniref:hypothetical protein n=1 Tax=Tunicatimonas pelagia TaxID=931531 RepID=UPI002666BF11|nr:hypothetical protein [Tunicatimonas pelagia]WKN41519.1 hypothetical protein P0M28_21005 [Tunicatimonas pelagia]
MTQSIGTLLLFLLAISIWGCRENDDSGGGNEVVPGQAIAGTWLVRDTTDAVVDLDTPPGIEAQVEAGDFAGFRLTITPTLSEVAYISQGNISPAIFPPQGTLVIEESDNFSVGAEVIRQPDLVPLTIQLFEADTASLQITFSAGLNSSIPTDNSRISGISGSYQLTMTKQQTQ